MPSRPRPKPERRSGVREASQGPWTRFSAATASASISLRHWSNHPAVSGSANRPKLITWWTPSRAALRDRSRGRTSDTPSDHHQRGLHASARSGRRKVRPWRRPRSTRRPARSALRCTTRAGWPSSSVTVSPGATGRLNLTVIGITSPASDRAEQQSSAPASRSREGRSFGPSKSCDSLN